jgi:hypothetical protein
VAIEAIIKCAENRKKIIDASEEKDSNPSRFQHLQECRQIDPKRFQKYELPSAWYEFPDVKQYVDVPMHLLMLGVVKSAMLRIGTWLRVRTQKSLFLLMTDSVLGAVKALNVEWCKILEYPTTDKFGGWISENFLGMSRLLNWFYSVICFLPEVDVYSDPTSPYTSWDKLTNQQWLEARGLPKTGKVGEIKKRVAAYFEKKNIPPIVFKNDCRNDTILEMINALSLMIHMLMSLDMPEDGVANLEATIRNFLIKYDNVDRGLMEKQVPSWISQYNFLCLLNLPDTIRMYGNIRNLWEGGSDGEGFLRRVKNELKPGLVHQWQKWSLSNLLRDKLYAEWLSNKTKPETAFRSLRKECKIYNSRKKAIAEITTGKPFSGIMIKEQRRSTKYVCFKKKGLIKGMKIIVSTKSTTFNGLCYYWIKTTTDSIDVVIGTADIVGLIFLPKLSEAGYHTTTDKTTYCLISSRWTHNNF